MARPTIQRHSRQADLQPPHEGVPNPNRMALKKKVFSGFCCFTFLVFGVFVIARGAGGCGCPAGYEISSGEESSCDCEGDIFNCEWKCYDACFKDGSETSCDGSTFNNTLRGTSSA